jgi:prepilin-type processing-associated H-X9-DG protein
MLRFVGPRSGPRLCESQQANKASMLNNTHPVPTFTALQEGDKSLNAQDKAMIQRHGGRWNQVFCDGHVENGGLDTFFNYQKDEVLKLWNRDNLPHREQFKTR